jgi:hypothetical protein
MLQSLQHRTSGFVGNLLHDKSTNKNMLLPNRPSGRLSIKLFLKVIEEF